MQQFLRDYDLGSGLTYEDYADFGKFIGIYVSEIEPNSGHYNWDDPHFKHYCTQNGIQQKGTKAKRVQHNHFWFDADKPSNMLPKDVAHNFLRHIRNAFSHGGISVTRGKHNRKYYSIRDRNIRGSQTMSGEIRSDLLWGMIEILIRSRI